MCFSMIYFSVRPPGPDSDRQVHLPLDSQAWGPDVLLYVAHLFNASIPQGGRRGSPGGAVFALGEGGRRGAGVQAQDVPGILEQHPRVVMTGRNRASDTCGDLSVVHTVISALEKIAPGRTHF